MGENRVLLTVQLPIQIPCLIKIMDAVSATYPNARHVLNSPDDRMVFVVPVVDVFVGDEYMVMSVKEIEHGG